MAPGGTVEDVKSPCDWCDWEDVEDVLSDDAVPEGATVSPAYCALSRKIQGIHRFLEERACGLYCTKLMRIKHSKPGTALHTRFMQACAATNGENIKLAFHGSNPQNIRSLCRHGLDPARRRCGGDYFAIDATTSVSYCRGGQHMLVCAVLTGPEHAHTAHYPFIVLQHTEHHLPLFVLSFQTEPPPYLPPPPALPVASPAPVATTPAPVAASPVQKDIDSPRVDSDSATTCCWRGRLRVVVGKGGRKKRHR